MQVVGGVATVFRGVVVYGSKCHFHENKPMKNIIIYTIGR